MVNPRDLMYLTDDYKPLPGGTIGGKSCRPVAIQFERFKMFRGRRNRAKNHVWLISGTTMLVYSRSPNPIAVMKMGLSKKYLNRLTSHAQAYHRNSVSAEEYFKKFVSDPDVAWLKRNRFELVNSF